MPIMVVIPKKFPSPKKDENDSVGAKKVTFDPNLKIKVVEVKSITKHVNAFY
jgi:hypothetical protein